MTYLDVQTQTRKVWPALVASLAVFLAGALSIGGVNLFGVHFGFGFIPFLIIAIWPRRAHRVISIAIVFFAGLFMDWATGGVVGQCALIFVLIWGFLRPELRASPFEPINLFLIWLAICGLALVVIFISGYFVFGILPDFAPLGRQMVLATVFLPLLMLLRYGLAVRFSDNEDWG